MENYSKLNTCSWKITNTGLMIGIVATILIVGSVLAAPESGVAAQSANTPQSDTTPSPTSTPQPKPCTDCHVDKRDAWQESPHAHSFDDPVFQEGWVNMEFSGDCLLCHRATYDEATGTYAGEGVTCETCHGEGSTSHPPDDMPLLSDEEYCGKCHPTTLGEVRLSGHSTANEVRCVDCHDPHSQEVLSENPDDICKTCHDKDDLSKMDEALINVHLQENIPCANCHTLDVPHTFLLNYQHEDTSDFFKGFDCTSEITSSVAARVGTTHEDLGSLVQEEMNWPIVHRVSRLDTAPQCSDCHIMDQKLREDFIALGYSPEDVDKISWDDSDFPALTGNDLTKLVATPRRNWSWVYWVTGILVVLGVFELFVVRKQDGARTGGNVRLASLFRKKSPKVVEQKTEDQRGKE